MINYLLNISLPLVDPVLIFSVILVIVLLSPLLLRKINIPDIIGLIIAGILIGPKGFNLLSEEIGFSIFGITGLLYLMFLAGLEIDLNEFLKNKRQGTWFGILSFIIPFVLGYVVFFYILHYDVRGSLLIAIMLASHTLVSYPIISRLGIVNHPIVTVIIAGTIIADTLVLIVLGLISDSVHGDLSVIFWLRTIAYFGIFAIYIIKILPALARWFFKYQHDEGGLQYVFILTAIFISASLAELLKIEPLIGAFFAGLSLNRLIVRTSPLMNRILFIGNNLFIPFFLISIGMRVDISVLFDGWNVFGLLLIMLALAFVGKWLPAYLVMKIFGYTKTEHLLITGLSMSRAASTIAIVFIGYNFDLVDDVILNNTVLLILATCLVSSLITQKAGQKIVETSNEGERESNEEQERILLPVSNPDTIQKLMEFSMILKDPNSKQPIYPVTVVQDGKQSADKNALNKAMMQKALEKGNGTDYHFEPITRIDLNVVDGLIRTIKELVITKVVIGWHGKSGTLDLIFGTILDKLLVETDKMIVVSKMITVPALITSIKVVVPENMDRERGYVSLIKSLRNISKHLNKEVYFYGSKKQVDKCADMISKKKLKFSPKWIDNDIDNQFLTGFSKQIKQTDLIIFICSRKNTMAHSKTVESFPRIINRYFSDNNILLVYPEQISFKSGIFNIYDYQKFNN